MSSLEKVKSQNVGMKIQNVIAFLRKSGMLLKIAAISCIWCISWWFWSLTVCMNLFCHCFICCQRSRKTWRSFRNDWSKWRHSTTMNARDCCSSWEYHSLRFSLLMLLSVVYMTYWQNKMMKANYCFSMTFWQLFLQEIIVVSLLSSFWMCIIMSMKVFVYLVILECCITYVCFN